MIAPRHGQAINQVEQMRYEQEMVGEEAVSLRGSRGRRYLE